jgi:GntR family transcriptional regulator, transcriptional repressor for pyruvate dehydrogenase complex
MSERVQTIRRPKVYEEVARRLRQWIASSRKPGDTLPPERQLVEMFGAGRSSIRDALHELQLLGVVETRHGIGTLVRDPAQGIPGGQLADPASFQRERLGDLIDFRRILEPPLAARAALRASDADIARMRQAIRRQAGRVGRGAPAVEEDCAFHELIARAAHNDAVLKVLDTIMNLLRPTREIGFQVEGRPALSLAGHREILKAIQLRDPAAAERAMRKHLEDVEAILGQGGSSTAIRPKGKS